MAATCAVVTGAGRGIGLEVARALLTQGPVLLTDLDPVALQASADSLADAPHPCGFVALDLTRADSPQRIRAGAEELGRWSRLAHCAGIAPFMSDNPRTMLDVNLGSTVSLVEEFESDLEPGDVALLIGSISAYRSLPGEIEEVLRERVAAHSVDSILDSYELVARPRLAYAASKRAVQVLAEQRSFEWGRRGARVLTLSPGGVQTRMAAKSPLAADDTAVGRRAEPTEIAAVADFLCSPGASYMTGIDVLVDGGARSCYVHVKAPEVRERWTDARNE